MVFRLLESFIREPTNWVNSQCKLQELESIESEINELMYFITMEKSYAFTFWKMDRRRIEASMVHFYTLLQLLVRAIIPYPTMTIFECKSANKLCINIGSMQKLMNEILKCMNPLAKFLSNPLFSQQQKLIQNFLENWLFFMKKLPTIKRCKLNHVHNLVKFICLTNPIQICIQNALEDQEDRIRKKSNTVGTQFKDGNVIDGGTQSQIKKCQSKKLKKSNSGVQFYRNPANSERPSVAGRSIKQKIFKFPQKMFQNALQYQIRKQSLNLGSLISLQNKASALSKNRSTTTETKYLSRLNTSATKDSMERKKSKARSSVHSKDRDSSQSKKKQKSHKTVSIHEKNSVRRIQTMFYDHQYERESERASIGTLKQQQLKKKEFPTNTVIKSKKQKYLSYQKSQQLYHSKQKFSINKGTIKKIGWDIIRHYISDRVRIKKLKTILGI